MRTARVVLLAACQIGLLRADAQCSDSLGNCHAPRSSLMQIKTLKQKQQLQTTFGAQLASFQKFTDEMVAKFGQAPDEMEFDNTTLVAVGTVLEFIEAMYASLVGYHDQDTNASAHCEADNISNHCELQYLSDETVALINGHNNTANIAHGEFVECIGNRSTECTKDDTLCQRYDAYRQQDTDNSPGSDGKINGELWIRGDGSTPQYLPDCIGQGHFGETYITAAADGTPEEKSRLEAMEACLDETDKWLNGQLPPPSVADDANIALWDPAKYDGLYPHFDNCHRTQNDCDTYHTTCKTKQEDFEDQYCAYELWWDAECGAWSKCKDGAVKRCTGEDGEGIGTCAQVDKNVIGRKADNETGMRLRCLLEVLFGEWEGGGEFSARLPNDQRPQALQACTDADYSSQLVFWDITCGVGSTDHLPEVCAAPCPPIPHITGEDKHTDAFFNAYYAPHGFQTCAPEPPALPTEQHGVDKNVFCTTSCTQPEGPNHGHSFNCNSNGGT